MRASYIRRDGRLSWSVVYPAAEGEGMDTAREGFLTRLGARFSTWLWDRR